MARPNRTLTAALRRTALRLRDGARYRWTHQGACNCGHLAQTVTELSAAEIHRRAVATAGDWGEHAVEYCPTSDLPIDHVIREMLDLGLELADLTHLERLSDRRVLMSLPEGERRLDWRKREDVVRYLEAWADQLEAKLPAPSLDRAA